MRFIYLSILAITLSFTMNTYAEKNPRVNLYYMYQTQESDTVFRVLCVEGLMFLVGGHNNGKAIEQMMSSAEHPMRCPIKEIEE